MIKYTIFFKASRGGELAAPIAILKHGIGGCGAFYVADDAVPSKSSCELPSSGAMEFHHIKVDFQADSGSRSGIMDLRVMPDVLLCMTRVDQLPPLSAEDLARQISTAAGPHRDYLFALKEHLAGTGHDDKELVQLVNAVTRVLQEQKPHSLFSYDDMMWLKERCDGMEKLVIKLFINFKAFFAH